MSNLSFTPKSGNNNDFYETVLTYQQAKAVVEEITGQSVTRIKTSQSEDADNAFCIWTLADGTYVTTPAGPSVEPGMSLKDLEFGHDSDMDTFVAYVPADLTDGEEA